MFRFFENLIQPFPAEPPTQPPNSLLGFCWHYTRNVAIYLLIMAVLTGLLALMEVSLFRFLGSLVDWLATKDRATFLAEESGTLWGMALIVLVFLPVTAFLHSLIIHQTLVGNYTMIMRWQTHRYLLSHSIAFYQNEFAGRLATKVLQTSMAVRESVMKILDVLLYVSIYFLGMSWLILASDARLVTPLVVWLLVYIGVLYVFIPKIRAISVRQAHARSTMTGRIVDSYNNISTVKLFAHDEQELTYSKQSMQLFLDHLHPQMRLLTQLRMGICLLNAVLFASVVSLSIYLWLQNDVTPGAITIAISLILRLNGMSQWIMWEVSSLFENIGTVQDGINTLSLEQEVQDDEHAPALQVSAGHIVFDRVGFHYDKAGGGINNLSLVINPGEKVGIVGRSGAGKSTLVNLLLRFHDIDSGSITIDGQSVSQIQQHSLRAAIGMVTQDTSLLHRTIRENIVYGKMNATESEMIAAATKAQAHDFIQNLVDRHHAVGYDAQVGERGVTLSGGQRQRIAIARVLLKDAPILILDEATSALDSEIEAAIQQSLYQLMEGKTVIAIAHRLSTIAAMDRLIVMDQGHIVEEGSHKALVARGGIYAQLWTHQSGGFLGD